MQELVESQLYQLHIKQTKLADVLVRFLTKLAVFDHEISQNSGKLLAAAISQVILKLLGKQKSCQNYDLTLLAGLSEEEVSEKAAELLTLSKTFFKLNLHLKQLKKCYEADLATL